MCSKKLSVVKSERGDAGGLGFPRSRNVENFYLDESFENSSKKRTKTNFSLPKMSDNFLASSDGEGAKSCGSDCSIKKKLRFHLSFGRVSCRPLLTPSCPPRDGESGQSVSARNSAVSCRSRSRW